jgi:hypothetical protein
MASMPDCCEALREQITARLMSEVVHLRRRIEELEDRETTHVENLAALEAAYNMRIADLEDEISGVGNLARRLSHVSPNY